MSEGTAMSEGTTSGAAPRRAVVTGASSGIGEATVRRLRAEGWDVLATARRAGRLERLAQETGATWLEVDVTSDHDVAALAAHVRATGGMDALVNNAGGALGLDPVEHGDIEGWRWMYETNVLGTLRVTKALLPLLRENGGGDVLVITSTAAYGAYEGGGRDPPPPRFDSSPIFRRFSGFAMPLRRALPTPPLRRPPGSPEKLSRMQSKIDASLPFAVCGFTMREQEGPWCPFDCAGIRNDHWTG